MRCRDRCRLSKLVVHIHVCEIIITVLESTHKYLHSSSMKFYIFLLSSVRDFIHRRRGRHGEADVED